MGNCINCKKPHTDPEKQDGDWCTECWWADMIRSKEEDSAGPVGTFMGRPTNATYRSRPPKSMLPPSEWKKYGY